MVTMLLSFLRVTEVKIASCSMNSFLPLHPTPPTPAGVLKVMRPRLDVEWLALGLTKSGATYFSWVQVSFPIQCCICSPEALLHHIRGSNGQSGPILSMRCHCKKEWQCTKKNEWGKNGFYSTELNTVQQWVPFPLLAIKRARPHPLTFWSKITL